MEGKDLLFRLKEHRPFASPAEQSIIDVVLMDPQSVTSMSVRRLADVSHTSPSSVLRFCRKMGCEGYKDFTRTLVSESAIASRSREIALQDITPTDTVCEVAAKVIGRDIRSMEVTENLLDFEVLSTCADLLGSSREVLLFGIGASLLVAEDFVLKLLRADKPCNLYTDAHNQLLCAMNAHPDDLAIVISYSGMTEEMVKIARILKERQVVVVAITRGSEDSPLAKIADYVLPVAATELVERGAAMASRMSQLAVVDALYAAYVVKNYDRCMELFSSNLIGKTR